MGEAKRRKEKDPNFGKPKTTEELRKAYPSIDINIEEGSGRIPIFPHTQLYLYKLENGKHMPITNPILLCYPDFNAEEALEVINEKYNEQDGYYVINHITRSGGYLGKDWNTEVVPKLVAVGLAEYV